MKILTEEIVGLKCQFIVVIADADNAAHINVKPSSETLKTFNSFNDPQAILKWVATREAKRINSGAYAPHVQINTFEEWQAQFNFNEK